ncbi:PAS domain-containing sensor histidine kinase [Paramagnetospirillum kuznetsovii]|uniref:histidine kinase n=1 Tax=Paramagnetospirillum kuznetsovii TaxID=2053833 RepID=A0A364NYL1_9PROT|nr:PAS-domain containing protein [Paramagnetospirillum kuznetsovii]RAU22090.1 PAS domain-containing sensor histidine kinase [Paramagnetospirillum kuznetsovii]
MTLDHRNETPIDIAVMQGVLDHLEQAISVFDQNLRLVLWNGRFAEMFHLPPHLLRRGAAFEDIMRYNAELGEYGPGDPEALVAERVSRARLFKHHRTERTRPDGRIIEIIGNPLPGGGFVTSYTDITVAHQVTDNLRESNERLDQMVERRTRALQQSEERHRAYAEMLEATVRHMPQGASVFDNDLKLVVANDGFFELTQVPPEFNVPGKPFEDFMLYNAQRGEYGPGNPQELARERVELARRMQPHSFDRVRPDGTVVEVRGNPIPGRGFISTFTNVTGRHQAEQSLRAAMTMARTMLDAPGLITFLFTLDGTIIDLNEGGATAYRRTKQSLIGENIYALMPTEVRASRASYAQQALVEARAIHFEDESHGRWYEMTITPYPVEKGDIPCLMVIAHEVTHRHLTEDKLREATALAESANRSKSEFLAAMSHELRTPLNAIIGFSEIIGRELFGPVGEQYRTYGQDINSAGLHLLAMINDILDISRIEIGAFALSVEDVAPTTLAESSLRLVTTRAEQNSVRLISSIPEGLPLLRVDVRRVKQVLLNLLANAVKFTLSRGSVTLSARLEADGGMAFMVSDTGIGMSEADIAVALAPFGQVESGLDRRFEGVGLGLPLAKSLMELHGGALDLDTAPGQGTTVIIRFPPSCVFVPA